jgi:hypothetical protein
VKVILEIDEYALADKHQGTEGQYHYRIKQSAEKQRGVCDVRN